MAFAEQGQRRGIVELGNRIETNGVESLKVKLLAIVEAERDIDRFDEALLEDAPDENVRLLGSGDEQPERSLDPSQRLARLTILVEQRLSLSLSLKRGDSTSIAIFSPERKIPAVRFREAENRPRRLARR